MKLRNGIFINLNCHWFESLIIKLYVNRNDNVSIVES